MVDFFCILFRSWLVVDESSLDANFCRAAAERGEERRGGTRAASRKKKLVKFRAERGERKSRKNRISPLRTIEHRRRRRHKYTFPGASSQQTHGEEKAKKKRHVHHKVSPNGGKKRPVRARRIKMERPRRVQSHANEKDEREETTEIRKRERLGVERSGGERSKINDERRSWWGKQF